MKHRHRWLATVALIAACADPLLHDPSDQGSGTGMEAVNAVLPALGAPCDLDPPGRDLVITTTDFATGSLTVVDTANRVVHTDVAIGSTDAVPFARDGRIFVVHRFGHDFVDVLAAQGDRWRSMGQHALSTSESSAPNPHAITLGPGGLAYVPLFGDGSLRVLDLTRLPGASTVFDLDLSAFADDDGNPEPSQVVACGDTVFVSVQRLSPSFAVVGPDALVAVDAAAGVPLDIDPDRPGGQGIELQGIWLRQLRRDPGDPSGHTLLGLTTGIERIDLETGKVTWAVTPGNLAAVGIDHYLLPLAFDVDEAGHTAYLASYGSADPEVDCRSDPGLCFAEATLYEVPLDDPTATPQAFARGFDAVERTLEVVGGELWFGSRRTGEAGLWYYDVSVSPPRELGGPLPTGLPPYSTTVMERP